MATVTMPPTEEARTVFRRLGYAIDDDGMEFVAERKWRRVLVTPVSAETANAPDRVLEDEATEGYPRLRCFVTWKQYTEQLLEYLRSTKPPYDWAIIGVDDGEEFDVVHPDSWV
ncbi:MAG: DUF7116 family protein [Halobacteriota archaeon]